ncbi:MAG: hypothetical protein Q8902_10190 [Bacteroidota bacterium]|nr:hypothetical protein [Bacteroidota bacterium]MDP4233479.1 hypothetical protein [Bacteroidota bacterium]MDP4243357.1 hypothetical protein [Bacteroidota bacterium]
MLTIGVLQGAGCSSSSSPNSSGSNGSGNGAGSTYFSAMSVRFHTTSPAYGLWVQINIDSAGHPMSHQVGDTLTYTTNTGSYGLRYYADTLHYWGGDIYQIVDSGIYLITFRRLRGKDTLTASFSIPVIPFRITAPESRAKVFISSHINDTMVYSPAGGTELWVFMQDRNSNEHVEQENSEPDNGRYVFIEDGYGDGFVQLLRHFVGQLSAPAPFQQVSYDYWEESKPLELQF